MFGVARQGSRIGSLLKFTAAFAISGVCLYFSARNIEFSKILQDIQTMQPVYALFSAVMILAGLTLRAYRWHQVVRRERDFAFSNTFWATIIGYLGNNILPARAGEIIRSVVLGLSSGIRKSLVLATALTERIIDAGVLLILAFVMLGFTVELPPAIRNSWSVILPVVLSLLALALLAPLMQAFWLGLIRSIPLIGESLKERLANLLVGILDGVRVFYNLRLFVSFLMLTVIIWLMDAAGTMVLARSFGVELTLPQATIFIAALGFASSVPSTPGYVGVFQAIAVLLLPVFGVSAHRAFLLVSFFQLLLLVITAIFGSIGWFIMQRRIGVARLERELSNPE